MRETLIFDDYRARWNKRRWYKRPLFRVAFISAASQLHWANAQISEHEDCSDGFDLTELDENLTAGERRVLVDEQFEIEISDLERCEQGGSGTSSGGSSAGGNSSTSKLHKISRKLVSDSMLVGRSSWF